MKMGNGTGSIVELSGNRRKKFAVRVTTGWKNGRQVRKYIGYYATQTEALMALAEYHKNGLDVDLTNLTVKETFDRWYERVEKRGIDSTIRQAKSTMKHLEPLFNVKISKLKTVTLQEWLDNVDLKPSTKGKLKGSVQQLYDFAVLNDIVSKNYAKGLEVNEKVEKTGAVFTPKEIEYLWKHKDDEMVRILLILIYTSMRIGELLLITKGDINFEDSYMVGGIKTEAGKNRVIPIHREILPLMKEQLGDEEHIVRKRSGVPMPYRTFYNNFVKFMEKLGWEHKIHDTRKTGISLMHSSGIPMETVRIIAGHSGKGVTERIYIYKEPKELVEEVNKIEIPQEFLS